MRSILTLSTPIVCCNQFQFTHWRIVEGGFNTQEINSAFDYDIVSSKDESLSSGITSSDETENGNDHEEVSVILSTPKKGKLTNWFELIMQNLYQHVLNL